jgi:hypothetical protein
VRVPHSTYRCFSPPPFFFFFFDVAHDVRQMSAILESHKTLPPSTSSPTTTTTAATKVAAPAATTVRRQHESHHASFTLDIIRVSPSLTDANTNGGLERKVRLCLLVALARLCAACAATGRAWCMARRGEPRRGWHPCRSLGSGPLRVARACAPPCARRGRAAGERRISLCLLCRG